MLGNQWKAGTGGRNCQLGTSVSYSAESSLASSWPMLQIDHCEWLSSGTKRRGTKLQSGGGRPKNTNEWHVQYFMNLVPEPNL